MSHSEFQWQSEDGLPIYAQAWRPEQDPRAVVALVHGLGEHSGRYQHVGAALNEAGYALVASDLRGHGKSGGPRGHSPSLEALSKDIDLLLSQARALSPGKPLFLYGHSLGGILVLYYGLVRRPALAGVISTSPGLHTALESQKGKVLLAKVLGLLAPSFVMPSGLDAQAICRDQAVVEAYVNDSLVHDRMSLGLAVELLEAIQTVLTRAPEFPVPLLLMHGSEDRIAFAESSREVASLVKAECTLKLWEGLSHETHNEPEKAQVLAYMIGWLDEHLPAA